MEDLRSYRSRGTPDCPIALYPITAGKRTLPFLHYHPEMDFIFLHEGLLDYRLDKEIIHMTAGDILVIAPQQIHGVVSSSPDVRFHILSASLDAITMPPEHVFQKEFVQPLQNSLLQLPSHLQPGHPAYEAVAEIRAMLPKCRMNAPNYKFYRFQTVISLCVAIAPWCIRLDANMKDTLPGNRAVRKAMLYIHNQYQDPLDLQTIADHVHLHPNYLCALFKEHTGQTVMQYLIRKRVDAAIFLLQDSSLPIEVIAEKSGFRSQGVFFRHFRQVTGTTPKAYRKHPTP